MTALSDWKSNTVTCISGATAQIRMMIVTLGYGDRPRLLPVTITLLYLALHRALATLSDLTV